MGLKKMGKIPDFTHGIERLKRTLPRVLANIAKKHFLLGFRLGGKQTDASSSGWDPRKKPDKNKKGRRAILVRTGQLRNDIDVRRTTFEEIVLGTLDTPYASYHNEGTERLPQREFLGPSRKLDAEIRKATVIQFDKVFKL